MASRLAAGRLFSQILLSGGMLQLASWALVALTGLGGVGATAVAVVVMVLFVHLVLATCRSVQAVRRLTQSRTCR
mgnify:CR=1 FL=1